MRVLPPHACGTTRPRQRTQTCAECHGPECSNYHEGSELCNIANGHPINSAQRVLNNTEVKERNTICRHVHVSAFTPRQCSFVTHLGTLRFRNYPYIYIYILRRIRPPSNDHLYYAATATFEQSQTVMCLY